MCSPYLPRYVFRGILALSRTFHVLFPCVSAAISHVPCAFRPSSFTLNLTLALKLNLGRHPTLCEMGDTQLWLTPNPGRYPTLTPHPVLSRTSPDGFSPTFPMFLLRVPVCICLPVTPPCAPSDIPYPSTLSKERDGKLIHGNKYICSSGTGGRKSTAFVSKFAL